MKICPEKYKLKYNITSKSLKFIQQSKYIHYNKKIQKSLNPV